MAMFGFQLTQKNIIIKSSIGSFYSIQAKWFLNITMLNGMNGLERGEIKICLY